MRNDIIWKMEKLFISVVGLSFFFGNMSFVCGQTSQDPPVIQKIEKLSRETSTFPVQEKLKASPTSQESTLTILDPETGKNNILNKIIKLFAQILGTFGVLMLVIGGILMITSEGDENRLQRGKNIFFYTVVGLLVAFMSFIAVQFIIALLFTVT